ncbi:MAG: acyl-CoA thioesterase [Fidelibacterota bacterium]
MENATARYSQLVMPTDLNTIGTLFGGKMISWMDIAASKAGQRFLRGTGAVGGVTKAIDKVVFSEPVYGGEWVNIAATVVSTGTTSFVVEVKATAESATGEERPVCEAVFTLVAVQRDKNGRWRKFAHGR